MSLRRITPEEAGISSRQVERCLEKLCHDKTEMHSFMAARNGQVFAECWWAPLAPDIVHSNHSFGKSYTATAIGIACREGLLGLDERIVDIFKEEIAAHGIVPSENLRALRVKHVLTMTNGHGKHPQMGDDWIGDYLKEPVVYPPGTQFLYNTAGTCMLSAIIFKKTGQHVFDYLKPRLFDKTGMDKEKMVWLKFKDGHDAPPATFATTENNLRLALLYLNGGSWQGEQIVDETWIREALSIQADSSNDPGMPDCRCGYGYQLWACSKKGVFRFDGGQGQYALIWPEKQIAVAVHEGATCPSGIQKTLDVLYEELLDQFQDEALPQDEEGYGQLLDYMSGLHIKEEAANHVAGDPSAFCGSFRMTEGRIDPWMAIAPGGHNFFTLFYDDSRPVSIEDFSLETDAEKCVFTVNGYARFVAWFDGKYRMEETDNAMKGLTKTCSTARYLDEDTLELTIRWINGWFLTKVIFRMGQEVSVRILKRTLQDDVEYLEYAGKAMRTDRKE